MFIIETKFGNFGTYRDLYFFMKDENINSIQVTSYYIFDKINTSNLSLDDVKKLMKEGR